MEQRTVSDAAKRHSVDAGISGVSYVQPGVVPYRGKKG